MPSLTQDTDFFIAGGTLRKDAPCYVSRPADHDLYEAIKRREFCYVLTSRQMGKSSLMIRTTNRLREEGIAVAVLDLTAIGLNVTPEQWYDGLLSFIGQQLGIEDELEDFWLDQERVAPMRRFFRALQEIVLPHVPGPVVLFIDEVDAVRSLPFSADEFFAGIREWYNRRNDDPLLERLTFGLFGVASPSDLIRDPRVTPFNIGHRIELKDFALDDAGILADALGTNGKRTLERVFYWTNGHPYLTLKLCRTLAEQTTPHGVDQIVETLFFSHKAQETDDNLLFVRRWLLESGADIAAILDLYRQVQQGRTVADDETNPLVSVLHLSGIVSTHRNILHIRNRVYERVFDQAWVLQHMPGQELRRQQEAYRRGVVRTSSLSTVIVLAMLLLTIVAFNQKSEAEREKARADSEKKRADQLAQVAQAEGQRAKMLANQIALNALKATTESRKRVRQYQRLLASLYTPILDIEETLDMTVSLPAAPIAPQPPVPSRKPINPVKTPVPQIQAMVSRPQSSQQVALLPRADKRPSPPPGITTSPVTFSPSTLREPTPIPATPTPEPITAPLPSSAPIASTAPVVIPSPTAAEHVAADTVAPDQPPTTSIPTRVVRKPEWNPPNVQFSGLIEVRVTINEDGSHTEQFLSSTRIAELDDYLRHFFAQWRWTPAKIGTTPIRMSKKIRFRIN